MKKMRAIYRDIWELRPFMSKATSNQRTEGLERQASHYIILYKRLETSQIW